MSAGPGHEAQHGYMVGLVGGGGDGAETMTL